MPGKAISFDSMFVFLNNVSLSIVSCVGTCTIRTVFAVCGDATTASI